MTANKAWMVCADAAGTKDLKEGERYLVEFRGERAKVLQAKSNPHRSYGTWVNANRFKSIHLWESQEHNSQT